MSDKLKHTSQHDSDLIDIKDILATILNEKWVILITTILFAIFGAIYCVLRTPTYTSNLLLNINASSETGSLSSVVSMLPSLFNSGSKTNSEIEIIKSRSVLGPVVKKLHLDTSITPTYLPYIGRHMAKTYDIHNTSGTPASPFLWFSSYSWGGDVIKLKSVSMSNSFQNQAIKLVYLGHGKYNIIDATGHKLLTGKVGKTATFAPNKYSHFSINIATIIARPKTTFIIEQQRLDDAITTLANNLSIPKPDKDANLLQLNLTGTNPKQIANILNAIAQTSITNDISRQSKEAAKTLQFLNSQLPIVKKNLDKAEIALKNYQSKTGNIQLDTQAQLLMNKLANFSSQISQLNIKKAQLKQQYTEKSFQMQQVETSIKQFSKQKTALEKHLKQLPLADQIAVSLMREAKVQNKIYTTLLNKIQQFELLKAGNVGNLSIIDDANVPYRPDNKPSSIIVALFTLLGLLLSLAYVFIKQTLWSGIEDPETIETAFNLPIMGTLFESRLQEKQEQQFSKNLIKRLKLLCEVDPHDLTVEGLRSLRTNLLVDLPKAKNNIIAICGPTPDVGKSFTAINLAHIMADSDKRILLIDGDIRKGNLHRYFNIKRTPGLCDLILGKKSIDEVIKKTHVPNLDFIPTGNIPTKHSEILMRPETKAILENLSKEYDYIVVDTAAALAVTDPLIICKHTGINLLVFGYGQHDEKELRLTINKFHKTNIEISGFIFNRLKQSATYYGNKYRYKYEYHHKK